MKLASEYNTLTANGLGQICNQLKSGISGFQNLNSSKASFANVNWWHQLPYNQQLKVT